MKRETLSLQTVKSDHLPLGEDKTSEADQIIWPVENFVQDDLHFGLTVVTPVIARFLVRCPFRSSHTRKTIVTADPGRTPTVGGVSGGKM